MEYKSSNSGILSPEMVKTGDKLIIVGDAYSKFVEAKQVTYWNAQVQLPDGSRKLASLFESACDKFAAKWGSDTAKWTGHTVLVEIKTAKNSGNPYIAMTPTDDPAIEVQTLDADRAAAEPAPVQMPPPPPPAGDIDPNDIPF